MPVNASPTHLTFLTRRTCTAIPTKQWVRAHCVAQAGWQAHTPDVLDEAGVGPDGRDNLRLVLGVAVPQALQAVPAATRPYRIPYRNGGGSCQRGSMRAPLPRSRCCVGRTAGALASAYQRSKPTRHFRPVHPAGPPHGTLPPLPCSGRPPPSAPPAGQRRPGDEGWVGRGGWVGGSRGRRMHGGGALKLRWCYAQGHLHQGACSFKDAGAAWP